MQAQQDGFRHSGSQALGSCSAAVAAGGTSTNSSSNSRASNRPVVAFVEFKRTLEKVHSLGVLPRAIHKKLVQEMKVGMMVLQLSCC